MGQAVQENRQFYTGLPKLDTLIHRGNREAVDAVLLRGPADESNSVAIGVRFDRQAQSPCSSRLVCRMRGQLVQVVLEVIYPDDCPGRSHGQMIGVRRERIQATPE